MSGMVAPFHSQPPRPTFNPISCIGASYHGLVAMEADRLQGLLRVIIVIRPIRLVLVFTG
jgi:hypothetical protein